MADSIEYSEFTINGVRVESAAPETTSANTPIVFVHGGGQGSWTWQNHLRYFAERGWAGYALNWFNHNGSRTLPNDEFLNRSIADVAEEIGIVANHLKRPPILIAHSMGGLASQVYASTNSVASMVLLAPVGTREAKFPPLDLPPPDPNEPFAPFPFPVTYGLFFEGSPQEEAEGFYELLCPESPRAILEATLWNVSLDPKTVKVPILMFAGESDKLVPSEAVQKLASLYDADYRLVEGRSHNLLLEPKWKDTADAILDWLETA